MSTNPVDEAIKQAEEQAEAVPANTPTNVPATVPTRATPLGLSDVSAGGLNVDEWLKVNEYGLMSGSHAGLFFEDITVTINMSEVAIFEGIRFGNKPVTYYKSYDTVSCTSGGTWADAMARAVGADPKARPYRGADIPMTANDDIVVINKKGDKVTVIEEGTLLGHSTSITNRKNLKTFIDAVQEAGLEKADVEVRIEHEYRKNNNGHEWGVLLFHLIGEADEEGPDETPEPETKEEAKPEKSKAELAAEAKAAKKAGK